MKAQEIQKFKKLFIEQRKSLTLSKEEIQEQFKIEKDETLDQVDLSSYEIEQNMRIRLKNREALYLKKVEKALERIHKGTFGECLNCEEEIELKRMEARPTTTLCVSCKEEQEALESQHIDSRKSKSTGQIAIFAIA